jgi:hypothetical protein
MIFGLEVSFGALISCGSGLVLGSGIGGGAGVTWILGCSIGEISINSIGTLIGLAGLVWIIRAAKEISAKWMSEDAVNDESNQRSTVI